jgi:hypothetical protein
VPFNFEMETDSRKAKTVAICESTWTLRTEMQFIETIDSLGDFFRSVESSTLKKKNNRPRLFKDGSRRRESMHTLQ